MVNSKHYWASPHGEKWKVKKEGNTNATSVHDTQAEAWEEAKRLARLSKGKAMLQGRNGRIRNEHFFGDDPYPPEG